MVQVKKDNSVNPWHVDEGLYKATVVEIQEKDGNRGTFLIWTFKVISPMQDGEEMEGDMTVSGVTPSLLQDDNKLDKWLQACGVHVDDGEDVDCDSIVGSKVRIFVVDKKKKDRVLSQVDKVLPLKKKNEEDEEEPKKTKKEKSKPVGKKKTKPEPEEDEDTDDDEDVEEEVEEDEDAEEEGEAEEEAEEDEDESPPTKKKSKPGSTAKPDKTKKEKSKPVGKKKTKPEPEEDEDTDDDEDTEGLWDELSDDEDEE